MSLILEALKKSEAERQLGRAPGLMSPTVRVSRRRGVSPWWGVLALAVAIVGGAAWWVNTHESVRERSADTAVESSAAPRAAAPAASAPAAPAAAPVPTAPAAPAPVAVITEPSPRDVETAAALPADPEFTSTERESLPVDPPIASLPPPPAPLEPPPAPAQIPATIPPIASMPALASPDTEPSTPPDIASTPPPVAPPPAPAADATPASSPAPDAPLEALPTLGQLMPEQRNTLPALKLSMHVYTAAPETRFVLIDGKRYTQGERIVPSLQIAEIRRDGAVLDFDGKRFLVPRP